MSNETEEKPLRFVLERPHADGCEQPMVNHATARDLPAFEYRDSLGRPNRHAWRRWDRWICNSLQCEASVLVESGSLGEMVRMLTDPEVPS